MERYRFLPLLLPLMATLGAAQEASGLQEEGLRFLDFVSLYYLPILGGILLVFLLFTGLNRILRRRYGTIDFLATASGILLSILLVVTGFLFLAAAAVLAWATAIGDITYAGASAWAVPLADEVQFFIQPGLDMLPGSADYLQNILLAVLILGGVILVFLGIYLFWRLPKASFYEIIKHDGETTFKAVLTRGREPLTPTVTFRVIDRISNQPSPDVKVILKHKEGAKEYNRYTDFNGEVVFPKIDGLYSQYYAYVEGDLERKRYWVIRTSIGAESVT